MISFQLYRGEIAWAVVSSAEIRDCGKSISARAIYRSRFQRLQMPSALPYLVVNILAASPNLVWQCNARKINAARLSKTLAAKSQHDGGDYYAHLYEAF